MNLYDLNYFSYRNHSLYRFDSKLIVVRGEREETVVSSTIGEEALIVATSHHDENGFSVNCGGVCNCYIDENILFDEESRSLSRLVYSHSYVSVVVVSVLGFAISKFVNDHIDKCYENAKRILYNEVDYDSSNLMCSIEDMNCESSETLSEFRNNANSRSFRKVYKCEGHCLEKQVTTSRLYQKKAQDAMKELDCTNKRNVGIVEITEYDKVPVQRRVRKRTKLDGTVSVYVGKENKFMVHANAKFRKYHLVPFCKSFETEYLYEKLDGWGPELWTITPCVATHSRPIKFNNIQCKLIKEF